MRKIYKTPGLEVTRFDLDNSLMLGEGSPTDPGNIITNPFTTSDPDATKAPVPWEDDYDD